MYLTIDLSDQNTAELEAAAREARMPADRYLAKIVALALETRHRNRVQKLEEHLDYMESQVVPGATADEMESALQEALAHVRQRRTWQSS
jgi:hypothetical protein